MIRALYDFTLSLAEHPKAIWALALVAFAESSVFPIPPDVLLIPLIIANPRKAWLFATVTLVASVLGGLAGYAIGHFAFEQIGRPILEALGKAEAIEAYAHKFNNVGFWAVLAAGVTPFPFKVITIMSGATAMPLSVFIPTAILARGLRFFAVAALLRIFGPQIKDFIERRLALVFVAFLLILIAGFVGVKYI
ncbi:MAG: YqaA family protein [Paracoccaceae bacterium]